MSVFNAPTLQDVVYSGACPLALAHGAAKLAEAKAGDKVRLNLVYAGTKVYDAKLITGALGAGVKVDLGFEYLNDEAGSLQDAFIKDADCATAGRRDGQGAPVTLAFDAYVVATVTTGTATGALDSLLTFEPRGK